MPDPELLTDQQIAEIDAAQVKRRESLAFHQGEYPGLPTPPYIAEMDALIATVKQLREQFFEEQARNQTQADSIMDAESEITSPQSQLEQLRAGHTEK